ncbi:MAG: EscU/YscU/HrcU family type III secretion system export apparatus switch protein [Candidatus Acidiferrales bacterium]
MADEQKTERATPRRRKKALERGQLARSRDLPAALALLSVAVLLRWAQGGWLPAWRGLFRNLMDAASSSSVNAFLPALHWTTMDTILWAGPPLAAAFAVSAFGLAAQGGFVVTPLAFEPKWERFNPANNLSRIFSVGGLSPLLKSLIPAAFLLYIAFAILRRDWLQLIHATSMGLPAEMHWLGNLLYEFSWKAGMVLLAWSAADYGLQRLNYERSLRMSKQEIRDEFKELEGNPTTRGRVRRLRRDLRRRQMMQNVRRATVVITNPDEFAVALEYIPEKMPAPLVLAKGRGTLAQKIKREARWHEVPIVENRPLAQALYRTVEVGGTIPAKLYTAVAEVLAFIYRAQARMRAEADARRANPSGAPRPVPGKGPQR